MGNAQDTGSRQVLTRTIRPGPPPVLVDELDAAEANTDSPSFCLIELGSFCQNLGRQPLPHMNLGARKRSVGEGHLNVFDVPGER
jgi:hypothetical protein